MDEDLGTVGIVGLTLIFIFMIMVVINTHTFHMLPGDIGLLSKVG